MKGVVNSWVFNPLISSHLGFWFWSLWDAVYRLKTLKCCAYDMKLYTEEENFLSLIPQINSIRM